MRMPLKDDIIGVIHAAVDKGVEVSLCVVDGRIMSAEAGGATFVDRANGRCVYLIHTHPRLVDSMYYSPSTSDVLIAATERCCGKNAIDILAYRGDDGRLVLKAYYLENPEKWNSIFSTMTDEEILQYLKTNLIATRTSIRTASQHERLWEEFLSTVGIKVERLL